MLGLQKGWSLRQVGRTLAQGTVGEAIVAILVTAIVALMLAMPSAVANANPTRSGLNSVVSSLGLASPASQPADIKHDLMVTEILRAAAQNGSLIKLDAGSAQVVAGVNRVVVPADGDSLAWGVIKITDSESSPMVNEFIEIATGEGSLYFIENMPRTDSSGNLIFAVRATRYSTVTTVRFSVPRLKKSGEIDIFFCSDCFDVAEGCSSISSMLLYDARLHDYTSNVCPATSVADKFSIGVRGDNVANFVSATFRPTNRPEDAFQEVVVGLYRNCCWDCWGSPCLRCGSLVFHETGFVGVESAYRLPNEEVEAEVEYLVYQSGGGRVCRQSFTYTIQHPRLILESPIEDLYVQNSTEPLRIRVRVESPVFQARRGDSHWSSPFLLRVMGVDTATFFPIFPIEVPTQQPVDIVIPRDRMTGQSINLQLERHERWPSNTVVVVDTVRGYLNLTIDEIFALGRNKDTRTFDFEMTYTLSLSRQLRNPRGASSGVIIVKDPDNREIHRVEVPRERLSLGRHTIVIKIPEDRMTRFGRYVFVPHFVDDLAGYYRDRNPRPAQVTGRYTFDTPVLRPSLVYTIVNPGAQNDPRRLSYPMENDECYLTALLNDGNRIYLYEPIPQNLHDAAFIYPASWSGDGGEEMPRPPSNRDLSRFFHRSSRRIPYFTNNRQAQLIGSNVRLWPGPKLEFVWLRLRHVRDTDNVHYYWTYSAVGSQSSSYRYTATKGTHYFAIAVSSPSMSDYIVTGPYMRCHGGSLNRRISKQEFLQRLRNNTLRSNCADTSSASPLRISVRGMYDGVPEGYRREVVRWASVFLDVAYEWGGSWFGGRASPRHGDTGNGYQGFGIDCSKLISASAMMAGLGWHRVEDNRAWWDIGTVHLVSDTYTTGWRSSSKARENVQPGDILVKPGAHAALIVEITRREPIYDEEERRIVDYQVWIRVIDASGNYDRVTENNAEHLIHEGRRIRPDTLGDLMTRIDRKRKVYHLRQLRRRE